MLRRRCGRVSSNDGRCERTTGSGQRLVPLWGRTLGPVGRGCLRASLGFSRLSCRQLGRRKAQQLAGLCGITAPIGRNEHLWFANRIWRRLRHPFSMGTARCRRLNEELIVANRTDHLAVNVDAVFTEHRLGTLTSANKICVLQRSNSVPVTTDRAIVPSCSGARIWGHAEASGGRMIRIETRVTRRDPATSLTHACYQNKTRTCLHVLSCFDMPSRTARICSPHPPPRSLHPCRQGA